MEKVQIGFDLGYLELVGLPEASEPSAPVATNLTGLVAPRPGGIQVTTNMWLGIADVGVTVADERPERVPPGWDVVGECSAEFTSVELVLCHPSRDQTVRIRERLSRTGWHRVRAHAMRSADGFDGVALDSSEERYHLVIWPSTSDEAPVLIVGEPVVARSTPAAASGERSRVGSEADAARPISETERAELKTASVMRLRDEIAALEEQISQLTARKRSLSRVVAMLESDMPPPRGPDSLAL